MIAPLLFTPGPLSTSESVKRAMMLDLGSRDSEFTKIVRDIRQQLLKLAGISYDTHSAVLMQGSGTFGIESVLSSAISPPSRLLIIINGAYGQRMRQIAIRHKINHDIIEFSETDNIKSKLGLINNKIISYKPSFLALVHSETTTGMLNSLEEICELSREHKLSLIIDAMSSFGGVPINLSKLNIDFLISSSNKCLGGVPGFSFVIAQQPALNLCEGQSRTLSLDLYAQWRGLESDGQFRFTPPTHAILAFHQALLELEQEGGISARYERFKANQEHIVKGLSKLGFKALLDPELQGPIISSFLYPNNNFNFRAFYQALKTRGLIIYPGKLSQADCFRIGHIGHIFPADCENLIKAISEVMCELA